jgi:hypothetical protein
LAPRWLVSSAQRGREQSLGFRCAKFSRSTRK